jgi:hypothetical protein
MSLQKLLKEGITWDENDGTDPMNNVPSNKYSRQILKQVIGEAKANKVLYSMSMAVIPKVQGGSMTEVLNDGKISPY